VLSVLLGAHSLQRTIVVRTEKRLRALAATVIMSTESCFASIDNCFSLFDELSDSDSMLVMTIRYKGLVSFERFDVVAQLVPSVERQ
jgi:hypothetical protein